MAKPRAVERLIETDSLGNSRVRFIPTQNLGVADLPNALPSTNAAQAAGAVDDAARVAPNAGRINSIASGLNNILDSDVKTVAKNTGTVLKNTAIGAANLAGGALSKGGGIASKVLNNPIVGALSKLATPIAVGTAALETMNKSNEQLAQDTGFNGTGGRLLDVAQNTGNNISGGLAGKLGGFIGSNLYESNAERMLGLTDANSKVTANPRPITDEQRMEKITNQQSVNPNALSYPNGTDKGIAAEIDFRNRNPNVSTKGRISLPGQQEPVANGAIQQKNTSELGGQLQGQAQGAVPNQDTNLSEARRQLGITTDSQGNSISKGRSGGFINMGGKQVYVEPSKDGSYAFIGNGGSAGIGSGVDPTRQQIDSLTSQLRTPAANASTGEIIEQGLINRSIRSKINTLQGVQSQREANQVQQGNLAVSQGNLSVNQQQENRQGISSGIVDRGNRVAADNAERQAQLAQEKESIEQIPEAQRTKELNARLDLLNAKTKSPIEYKVISGTRTKDPITGVETISPSIAVNPFNPGGDSFVIEPRGVASNNQARGNKSSPSNSEKAILDQFKSGKLTEAEAEAKLRALK